MKRKIKESESGESGDAKNQKKSKVEDESENLDQEEQSEPVIDFDVKIFRQAIKSESYFDEIKNFIKRSSKNSEIISEFLTVGKPIEFVELLKKHEGTNLEVISSVFQCFYLVLSYIEENAENHQKSIPPAVKFLISKNAESINRMISSSKTTDKVMTFKILTIAMKIENEIGHEVIKNIEIFSKGNQTQELPFYESKQAKKATMNCPVRRSLIDLFMTFLTTHTILRKKILSCRQLFEFIMRDLYKDSYDIIKLLLTAITKIVLISPDFGKPEKRKIFSENVVKSLLKVYEWKQNPNERESICTIVHQFLLLLLTSKKHGIVVKALSENRQNQRQLQVINVFKNVWNFEYPSMLVIEIVKSCPELMQNVLNRLVMGLQLRGAATASWFMCANFTKCLLTALDPELMMGHFAPLESKKISNNIIKMSISQFLLQNLNERALIQQNQIEVREVCVELLHLMLDRSGRYMIELRKLTTLKDFEKHRIRFDAINNIFTYYPNVDVILNSLYRSINLLMKMKTPKSEQVVKSQLTHTLNIILLLTKHFPSAIEKIPSVIDFLSVLKPIYEWKFSETNEKQKNENLDNEMKIAQIILLLQPNILTLESEMFTKIFTTLVQVYCGASNENLRRDAELIIIGMLQRTSIFNQSNLLEIQIWLEAFKSIKKGSLSETITTFVNVLKSMSGKGDERLQILPKSDEKCSLELLSLIDREEISDEVKIELSPVLLELLNANSNKINRIVEFIEISIVHFCHSFPQHKKLISSHLNSELNTNIGGYLKSKKIVDFHQIIGMDQGVYGEFCQSIMKNSKTSVTSDVEDVNKLQLLIVQAIFYANQLNEKGNFDCEKSEILCHFIKEFYGKIVTIESCFDQKSIEIPEEDGKAEKKINKICELSIVKPSTTVVNYIFQHEKIFASFSIKEFNQITEFVCKLIEITQNHEEFEKVTRKFKVKILTEIEDVLENGKLDEKACKVIENFSFNFDDYFNLLTVLVKQKSTVDKTFVQLLLHALNSLTKLRMAPLSNEVLKKIEKVYLKAAKNAFIDVSDFDQALLDYLSIFPEINNSFTSEIFELACDSEWIPSKSYVRLITKIFSLTSAWNSTFKENLKTLKKEALYPLIPIAIQKKIVTQEQLKQIYQDCKSGMLKAIEKPTKAAHIYRDNIETSLKLIELVMPLNECNDLTMKKYKFDSTQLFQLKMIQEISTKAFNVKQEPKIFDKFVSVWLKLFSLADADGGDVLDNYLAVLENWMQKQPHNHQIDFQKNEDWETFIRICLKNGLKSSDKSKMLVTFGKFVRSANINNVDAGDEIAKIFDMILTHSNFFNIVFNFKKSGKVLKTNLFYLLNILVMRNPSVAQERHVQIFLSSYQATMSNCDQLILNLLRFYELKCGIDFHKFRPFLHGPLALSFYTTATNNDDQKLKLIEKEAEDENVSIGKLLNTFDKSMIEKTTNNFPIDRNLRAVTISDLDNLLVEVADIEIYDPCYFLPLFAMIVTSTSFGFTGYAVNHHLMSIILPALSCHDENFRLLAGFILLKCRESTEFKKKKMDIWIRFYDALTKGLRDISGPIENDMPKNFPRASSISTQLLAKFSTILPDTLHNVYSPVSNYLAVRESFDFSTIPEILLLLQSSEIQHEEYRLFLLNVIFHGIKDELDIKLMNNTPIMKIILFCYGSPISSRKSDLLILQILNQILMKTKKLEFLLDRHGLICWLMQAAIKVEPFEYDLIEMMLSLMENTQELMMKANRNCAEMFQILLILLKKLSKGKITSQGFASFLKCLNMSRQAGKLMESDIELVHEFIHVFIPEIHMKSLNYNEKLLENSLDDISKKILNETKKFLLCKQPNTKT